MIGVPRRGRGRSDPREEPMRGLCPGDRHGEIHGTNERSRVQILEEE